VNHLWVLAVVALVSSFSYLSPILCCLLRPNRVRTVLTAVQVNRCEPLGLGAHTHNNIMYKVQYGAVFLYLNSFSESQHTYVTLNRTGAPEIFTCKVLTF
jgi:hypothetical protein